MDEITRNWYNYYWYYFDLVSTKIAPLAKLYEKYIGNQYRKEIREFGLEKHQKVLHIGSGSFPISAFVLSENNGMKVVGIDRNQKSVERAKNIVKKRKLDDKIEIVNSNGIEYPLDDFDLIIVSGCSVPKIPVLKHVFGKSSKGSRIIVREGEETLESFFELLTKYQNISLIKEIKCSPYPTARWRSYYLEKN